MRVLFLSSGLANRFGGAAISEASLCAALGSQVDLTVLCRQDRFEASFAKAQGLGKVQLFKPRQALDAMGRSAHPLHKVFEGVDVFHLNGHWRWENYCFARLCHTRRIPYLLHPRGMFLVGHRKPILKRVFNRLLGNEIARNAAAVIALSHFEIGQFAPYPIRPERTRVIPNGVTGPAAIDGTGPGPAEPYFLYFGRIEARKNLLFLIEVFGDYIRYGGKYNLYLAGPAEHGHDREVMEECRDRHLLERVKLIPPVYDRKKWELLSDAAAVVYPSVDEPFGRVPFETVLAGSFPIVPDESGAAEYLRRHLPDCIYASDNPASLLNTLLRMERKELPRAALVPAADWIRRDLDWRRISGLVLDLYREVAVPAVSAKKAG